MSAAKRVVIVICDGLRADMINESNTPNLVRISKAGAACKRHGGVFPSTTRTTAASIATGCLPGKHGLEGNAIALDLGNGYEVFSVGPPEFRDKLFAARGRTLNVPTMAERVKESGGYIAYTNASPGAGMFLDPDGHGSMVHRVLVTGPEKDIREPLGVSHDTEGDAAMTRRFIDEIVLGEKPSIAMMWMCEPDHTQHEVSLGSPAHIDVIRAADAQAGRVFDNIRSEIERGEILLICASDHGHETVREVVDLEEILVGAGLKDAPGSPDVAIAPQGTSATICLSADAKQRASEIVTLLRKDERFERVVSGADIAELGLNPEGDIDIVVIGKISEDPSADGVPGTGIAFQGDLKIPNNVGCGQHGGLGRYEQSPFLICVGTGFAAEQEIESATSVIDIAPTALYHLGENLDGMDGRALQS